MEKDINEAFDDICLAENRFVEKGYIEGHQVGLKLGWIEGFEFGVFKGGQTGSEIAFYAGFVESAMLLANCTQMSKRCLKSLEAMQSMVTAFPSVVNEDTKFAESLNAIRGKFKQICSLLGISSDITGHPSQDF